ncbi:uncharacterized protein LOC124361294 [Homalodisca vitripennis]|uniref:uncharacterized protein LOC124361294 n=1 Tax=Homalodisca vitripennis TaxID=197043 RepID=UPI001EEC769A|nr:uncharacterized protein LOC124361294 [Homalodisca vitripennis]
MTCDVFSFQSQWITPNHTACAHKCAALYCIALISGSLVRNRRLTCDVFSFQSQWITPNHAACALKCAALFLSGCALKCAALYCIALISGSLVRNRRLTCDVFSFQSQWITPNHAACALKCAALYCIALISGSLVRNRRLTCDVFSFQSQWITPNHAACALKCAAQFWKYKGGRCVNGNCHCTPRG